MPVPGPDRGRGEPMELLHGDALAQAAAVAAGACSATELVEASVRAIEALDPAINAVIHRRFEAALAEAAAITPGAPFAGVPLLVKDAGCTMAGEPRHDGLALARRHAWRASHDDEIAERIRAAGFIVVGRTNVPELCTAPTTEPVAFGPTRNPWNPACTVGGSSGGSAAAVAAGMVAVAHGTDGGGSIRMPASLCGLVGLKPTRGRVTAGPEAGERWAGHSTDGFLTRSVRDAAAALDAVAGPGVGDPYAAPALGAPLLAATRHPPPPLRIGVRWHGFGNGPPAEEPCRQAVAGAAAVLEGLGHAVVEDAPAGLDETDAIAHRGVVVAAALAAEVDRWSERLGRRIDPSDLEPWNDELVAMGREVTARTYLASLDWLQRWSRRLASWWAGGFDLLVTPTLTGSAFEVGSLPARLDAAAGEALRHRLGWLTPPWNVTGQPAISLPAGLDRAGVPVGVQLVAGAGREELLISAAAQLEAALDAPAPPR